MWNFSNDRPVYLQIMDIIKLRIATGQYPVGGRIPSVRDLAEEARVNPNTMQKALSEIEREGYLFSLRTSGKFVTDNPETVSKLKSLLYTDIISEFVNKMRELGIDPEQAAALVKEYTNNENQSERGND